MPRLARSFALQSDGAGDSADGGLEPFATPPPPAKVRSQNECGSTLLPPDASSLEPPRSTCPKSPSRPPGDVGNGGLPFRSSPRCEKRSPRCRETSGDETSYESVMTPAHSERRHVAIQIRGKPSTKCEAKLAKVA